MAEVVPLALLLDVVEDHHGGHEVGHLAGGQEVEVGPRVLAPVAVHPVKLQLHLGSRSYLNIKNSENMKVLSFPFLSEKVVLEGIIEEQVCWKNRVSYLFSAPEYTEYRQKSFGTVKKTNCIHLATKRNRLWGLGKKEIFWMKRKFFIIMLRAPISN